MYSIKEKNKKLYIFDMAKKKMLPKAYSSAITAKAALNSMTMKKKGQHKKHKCNCGMRKAYKKK